MGVKNGALQGAGEGVLLRGRGDPPLICPCENAHWEGEVHKWRGRTEEGTPTALTTCPLRKIKCSPVECTWHSGSRDWEISPKLIQLLALDLVDPLAAPARLLFQPLAFLEDSNALLHLLLLVLTHLPPDLIRVGLLQSCPPLLLLSLFLNLLPLDPAGRDIARRRACRSALEWGLHKRASQVGWALFRVAARPIKGGHPNFLL